MLGSLKYISIVILLTFISACATTAHQNISEVKSNIDLAKEINIPMPIKVAYYYPFRQNFEKLNITPDGNAFHLVGRILEKSLDFMMPSYFEKPKKLTSESEFSYLLAFKANIKTTSTTFKKSYDISLDMRVLDINGKEIFTSTSSNNITSSNAYDDQAIINGFNTTVKENVIKFLNQQANTLKLDSPTTTIAKLDFKKDLKVEKPVYVGSGFFINKKGQMLTSTHLLHDCLYIEARQEDKLFPANMDKKSILLDITVLSSNLKPKSYARFRNPNKSYLTLGEDIFTIGYPLANILSGDPNLTSGNISSLGALKGSRGFFQFTAPVQSGSSGSPIVSKSGALLGMVSSTLNQKRFKSTPQNVNFGASGNLIMKYLKNNSIPFSTHKNKVSYAQATKESNSYSTQVACYK